MVPGRLPQGLRSVGFRVEGSGQCLGTFFFFFLGGGGGGIWLQSLGFRV